MRKNDTVQARIPRDLDSAATNYSKQFQVSKKEVFKLMGTDEIVDIKRRKGTRGKSEYVDVIYKKTFLSKLK